MTALLETPVSFPLSALTPEDRRHAAQEELAAPWDVYNVVPANYYRDLIAQRVAANERRAKRLDRTLVAVGSLGQPACSHSVYRRIHVVKDSGELLVETL